METARVNAEGPVLMCVLDGAMSNRGNPLACGSDGSRAAGPRIDPVHASERGAARLAFDEFLVHVQGELNEYLCRRVRNPDTAADLTQESLSRMMKYRDDASIGDRRLMLFRIANNLLAEFWRSRHRHHADAHVSLAEVGALLADDQPAEVIADARQALDLLLNHTIVRLPPKCRLAFMLSRFDGMSHAQVAARMGISVKMVEKHVARAMVACRAAVGDRDF